MGIKYFDRVKDSSTTVGAGNVTLAGTSYVKFRAFGSVLAVGETFPYYIEHDSLAEWETGIGTLLTATTFSRSVNASSNANALVVFSAGNKTVGLDITASLLQPALRVLRAGSSKISITDVPASNNVDVAVAESLHGDIVAHVNQRAWR